MEKQRTLVYNLRYNQPPEVIWPTVSETQRLNLAAGTGFAPYAAEEVLQSDGSVVRQAHKKMGLFTWRWKEGFGEWVEGRFCNHVRRFENGPFRELSLNVILEPDRGGTVIHMEFLARWRSVLGDVLAAIGALSKITRPVVDTLDQLVQDHLAELETGNAPPLPPIAKETKAAAIQQRLGQAVERLKAGPYGFGLADQLRSYLLAEDAVTLKRLRPLALAKRWQVPAEDAIALFVAAHTAGLLSMRWEILCPRCRGGKAETESLADLPTEVHCSSCNIDYGRDFTNNVELVFSPSAWLRDLPQDNFCMMSPATTPHVKLQCEVAAGATRIEPIALTPGRYRVRTVEAGGEQELDYTGGELPAIYVSHGDVQLLETSPEGSATMVNRDARTRTVVIESAEWSADALTGQKVILNPAFRKLCPEQLLRPGDDAGIGQVAILFTDLKGSTALYEAIGDSRAFALVRDHFTFLEQRVVRRRGVLIKTIGDAVMAAFPTGEEAVLAALDIQDGVQAFNQGRGEEAIVLKLGVHEGACVAVTNHGVLDYFGTTVNLAARLQSQADGGQVIVSEKVFQTISTLPELAGIEAQRERASVAGFAQPVDFVRLSAAFDTTV